MAEPPFITRFHLQQFRCINDCELKLTRLHALVGPNDSGKSTLLQALQAAQQSLGNPNALFNPGPATEGRRIELGWSDGYRFRAQLRNGAVVVEREEQSESVYPPGDGSPLLPIARRHHGGARLFRIDPDEMRKPTPLIPTENGFHFDDRGHGLPSVYDALLARKRRAFDAIEADLIRLFPQVESLVISNASQTQKELAAQLRGQDAPVRSSALSEGMLYFLAFKALPHVDARLILIEEPENGLHPARIAEVMRVFRELSKTVQVVLATHSPLVINELAGDEISVVTRDDVGTHATLLSDTPRYEERATVYKNGEIWLAYADGDQEAALLEGRAAQ